MVDDREPVAISGLREMLNGVVLCHEHDLTFPMLTLIYANIDALGWLASDAEDAAFASFTSWVDRFMQPETTLGCSARELYAARCGLLHTGSSESRLFHTGQVRQIVYASQGDAPALQTFVDFLPNRRAVAIDTEILYRSYVDAVYAFDQDRRANPDSYPCYLEKMLKTFMAKG